MSRLALTSARAGRRHLLTAPHARPLAIRTRSFLPHALPPTPTRSQVRHASSEPDRPTKTVAESALSYSYKFGPEHCDEHGRVFGGEILKVIDVATGTVASRHSGGPGLTASVDRVNFFEETRAGDILHVSATMNRAFGTSMEVSARILLEKTDPSHRPLSCDAVLTFVALPRVVPPPSTLFSLLRDLKLWSPKKPKMRTLPDVSITTMQDADRSRDAGDRREKRVSEKGPRESVLRGMREWMWSVEPAGEGAVSGEGEVEVVDTLTSSMSIVMPEDTNSKNILFGGVLIRWMEQSATLAPRRLGFAAWTTASIDEFSFRSSALPGDAVYFRSCVTRAWDSSVEVHVVAMGGSSFSYPETKLVPVADAYFTLVALDPTSGEALKGHLKSLAEPDAETPVGAMVAGAAGRRKERLRARKAALR